MAQRATHNITSITTKAVAIAMLTSSAAWAVEKKIDRSALPPAVEKTVEIQSQGATIKGFVTDTENGKTTYEVEMTFNGHGKDIEIAKDGSVLEVEEEVALESLPAAAKSALEKRAAGGKVVKVEAQSRGGKLVAYEGQIAKGAKKSEILVTPNGNPAKDED